MGQEYDLPSIGEVSTRFYKFIKKESHADEQREPITKWFGEVFIKDTISNFIWKTNEKNK